MAYMDSSHREQVLSAFRPTLPKLSLGDALAELSKLEDAFRLLAFTGNEDAGSCALDGAKAGDRVIGVINITDGSNSTDFEGVITVDDEIQQTSESDLSTKKFMVLLVAKS